ncbi:alpha/beta fold hydrolase [Mycetocola sp.]|uniref:alpha/beta fold hydrolase n=1 Tax=Mycetocola sp. TaxID=1871042 RepID=UPI00398919E6
MPTDQLSPVQQRNNVTVSGNPAGRPMVFAHGFGCSQEMWSAVAPFFEQDYRVVRYDQVGAGGSDVSAYDAGKYDSLHGYAEDLLDILDDLDLHDAVFVGHSVSAMIGVLAAVRKPDRFGALILVGPSPRYINADGYIGGHEQEDIDSLLDALDANYLGWSATIAPMIVGHSQTPALGESLTESFCSIDPMIAGHFARVTFLSDNRRDLRDVTTPTLILQCQEDIIAPLPVGEFVHSEIPGSSLVVMSATGHCPNLSAPEELRDEIRAYLG